MKKLIGFLAIILVLGTGIAQAQVNILSRYAKVLDTVTNTGTKVMTGAKVGGPMQTVTVTALYTNLTGTLKGTGYLFGSVDNITFNRIRASQLQGAQVDSILIDAAHPKYAWVVEKSPFQYYQVSTTGQGTTTFTVQGKYVAH